MPRQWALPGRWSSSALRGCAPWMSLQRACAPLIPCAQARAFHDPMSSSFRCGFTEHGALLIVAHAWGLKHVADGRRGPGEGEVATDHEAVRGALSIFFGGCRSSQEPAQSGATMRGHASMETASPHVEAYQAPIRCLNSNFIVARSYYRIGGSVTAAQCAAISHPISSSRLRALLPRKKTPRESLGNVCAGQLGVR